MEESPAREQAGLSSALGSGLKMRQRLRAAAAAASAAAASAAGLPWVCPGSALRLPWVCPRPQGFGLAPSLEKIARQKDRMLPVWWTM